MTDRSAEDVTSRAVDGALAAGLLLAVVAAGVAVGARPAPLAGFAGAAGAVGLELLAGRRREAIRAAWADCRVRAAAAIGTVAAVALLALLAPPALSAVAGGLLAYLLLLAGVALSAAFGRR